MSKISKSAQAAIVAGYCRKCGYKTLKANHENANGPDLWITKESKAMSVEIKRCRVTERNSIQVPPVEPNRRNDDLIAIIHPTGYVLIESMKDHLKLCSPKGYRTIVF